METKYNISLIKNIRYILLISLSFVFFCISLFLYKLTDGVLFLILSLVSVVTISYFIIVLNSQLHQMIILDDDRISFKRKKNDFKTFYFRDIKFIGYYKKDYTNKKFVFGDGLYLYNEKLDNYFLIGIGFSKNIELYEILREKSKKYNLEWIDINREKNGTLVEKLQDILNTETKDKKITLGIENGQN